MVDELAVTNEIWRKWNEAKIKPPMAWAELRKKVEEYVKAGKDPYDIIFETQLKMLGGEEAKPISLPWSNPEPEAVVEERELPTFAEWLLAAVKRVWETKKGEIHWEWLIEPTDKGVLVGLRGVSRPHELFPKDLIESRAFERGIEKVRAEWKAILYFETPDQLETAVKILSPLDISFRVTMPSRLEADNPDYVLEVLASSGFDTSKILVERG